MKTAVNIWRTFVDWYALILTVIVLYDHRGTVQTGLAWIGDKLRKK